MSAIPPSFCVSFSRLPQAARRTALAAALALPLAAPASLVLAQSGASAFSPVMQINDSVITHYELDQRMLFLKLLRTPGDPKREALKGLTQDRLAAIEAKRVGYKLTPAQIKTGMEEFASRASMSADQLIEALGQAGVSAETYRDFVSSGLIWREMVRGRYISQVKISEVEIDRALSRATTNTAVQLLMSELVIPVEGDPEPQLALARQLKEQINSEAGFAAAAQRYSASPTASRGGRLEWMSSSNLPPQIVQMMLGLAPGQVSEPIQMQGAVAIFQLRDVTEDKSKAAVPVTLEYAELLLPNTADVLSKAASIAASIDTCGSLYDVLPAHPGAKLTIEKKPASAVPSEVGTLMASLDPGEYSAALTRGNARLFLMLCSRTPIVSEETPIDRNAIREQLLSEKLNLMAEGYLEELRSEAIIKTP